MLKWIETRANGWTVLVFLALALGLYLTMVLGTIPTIRAESGGVEVFDLRFAGYSEADARLILSSLPESARAYYGRVQIPIDFAYPAAMALFGAFALAWARRRVHIPRWSLVLPFVPAAFDYLENIFVLLMLSGSDSTPIVTAASIWTISKSVSTTVVMTGLVAVIAVYVYKSMASRRVPRASA